MTGTTARTGLADAPWLTRERTLRTAAIFTGLMLLVLAGHVYIHTRSGITSAEGKYLGADFINYWGGAHLAAEGNSAHVYDLDGFMTWQRNHSAPNAEIKWYSYPPTTLLLSLPLALFNYKTALIAWLMTGWALHILLLKRTADWEISLVAAIGTPTSLINAISGQNGEFSATLLCGGVLFLEKRPLIAGVLFGLLSFKPHLAVLVPFALAAGGYRRSFVAAAATLLITIGASWTLFGDQTWSAFFHTAPFNVKLMEHNDGLWHRMPTIFAMTRLLGGSIFVAYFAQAISAAAALTLTVRAWKSKAPFLHKGAILIMATFLTTPYAWDYDLVSLTFVIVWLAQDGQRHGFVPWEKRILALTVIMTLVLSPIGAAAHIQIGPLVIWTLLISSLYFARTRTRAPAAMHAAENQAMKTFSMVPSDRGT